MLTDGSWACTDPLMLPVMPIRGGSLGWRIGDHVRVGQVAENRLHLLGAYKSL